MELNKRHKSSGSSILFAGSCRLPEADGFYAEGSAPRMKVVLMLTLKRWSPTWKNKLTLFSNESSPKSFYLVDLHELRLGERKLLRDFPVTRRRQSLEDALDVRVLGKDGGLQLFVTFLLLQMKWRSSTKAEKIRSTDGNSSSAIREANTNISALFGTLKKCCLNPCITQ